VLQRVAHQSQRRDARRAGPDRHPQIGLAAGVGEVRIEHHHLQAAVDLPLDDAPGVLNEARPLVERPVVEDQQQIGGFDVGPDLGAPDFAHDRLPVRAGQRLAADQFPSDAERRQEIGVRRLLVPGVDHHRGALGQQPGQLALRLVERGGGFERLPVAAAGLPEALGVIVQIDRGQGERADLAAAGRVLGIAENRGELRLGAQIADNAAAGRASPADRRHRFVAARGGAHHVAEKRVADSLDPDRRAGGQAPGNELATRNPHANPYINGST